MIKISLCYRKKIFSCCPPIFTISVFTFWTTINKLRHACVTHQVHKSTCDLFSLPQAPVHDPGGLSLWEGGGAAHGEGDGRAAAEIRLVRAHRRVHAGEEVPSKSRVLGWGEEEKFFLFYPCP